MCADVNRTKVNAKILPVIVVNVHADDVAQ